MAFEIDPRNVTFEDIKADLEAMVAAQPDADRWSDFFASGTGQLLTNMVAALGAFLSYNIIVGRREAYHRYAQNRSSLIGGAAYLGHSAYRGTNARLSVTFIPTTTGTLPRWTVLGTVKDRSLILESDTVVNAGVESTVRVIVGAIKTETILAPTTLPHRFQFTKPNVSQDVRVYMTSSEVQFSERIVDLIDAKFVVQSNVFGSVDVLYLNQDTFPVKYVVGTPMRIDWIELYDLLFSLSDVKWTSGTMTDVSVATLFQSVEANESIRINGPLANETQFTIRGREDYVKIVKQVVGDMEDVRGADANPAIVRLFYTRPDSSIYSASEKNTILQKLTSSRPFGVMPPDIADPDIVFYALDILAKTSGVGAVESDINTIVDALERKLGVALSLDNTENSIEDLSYINIARVTNRTGIWAPNSRYRKGALLLPTSGSSWAWRVGRVVYRSAAVEPVWPLSEGTLVTDGRVIWCSREKTPGNTTIWQANKDYKRSIQALSPDNPLADKGPSGDTVVPTTTIGYPATHSTAIYSGVTFTSVGTGETMNGITLYFDNSVDIDTAVAVWNGANAGREVTFSGAPGSTILPGQTVVLSGGMNFVPVDLEFEVVGFVNRSASDSPAQAASAVYGGVTFTAATPGSVGNTIALNFDGIQTVAQVKTAWNNGNPGNQVTSPLASDSVVPPAGSVTLGNGSDFASGEPAWPSSGPC